MAEGKKGREQVRQEPAGLLCLFLHAHLPYVRHPEDENFLEELWLYEAITETYLPLLNLCRRLLDESIPFRFSMSLTPPLATMLRDPLLTARYVRHVTKLIELSEKELDRTAGQPHYHTLAVMYHRLLSDARRDFTETYGRDLVGAFSRLQEQGCIEIVASAATHGFLPLLNTAPTSVRAQIKVGVDHYRKTFGRDPAGFWLPECGYFPGVDQELKREGVRYFFLDTHGIVNADPSPRYGVYAPVYCPTGVAAFGRDGESSKQVWSSKEGYPGDPFYREYYRDIGHELDMEYIRPYIHPMGIRINTGLKYWRITGETELKEPYLPEEARKRAEVHAGNFLFNRGKQIQHLLSVMDRAPVIVAPYDAELFGHWWFEGPQFLDFVFRKAAAGQDQITPATPSDYLDRYPINQMCLPSASSWGDRGYSAYWLDKKNDWLYRHLHVAATRMASLSKRFHAKRQTGSAGTLSRRALNQAARELLLAQSSDWPFIMKSGTMVPYAHRRFTEHVERFMELCDLVEQGKIDRTRLKELEGRDLIFSDQDCLSPFTAAPGTEDTAPQKAGRKKESNSGAGLLPHNNNGTTSIGPAV